MGKSTLFLSFTEVLFCCISLHGQNTVTMNPVKDNTLYEDATGSVSNGAGIHFFVGLNNLNSKKRGLVKFDIASNVPAGAILLEATLTLTVDQTNSGPNNVELHAVSADWGEGASVAEGSGGNGAPAQTDDATWLYNFYNHSYWNNAGGDFNASISATTLINGIGIYNWTSPQLVADVQKWLDAPSSNFGWCLIGNEAIKPSAMRFASKEIATPTSRPTLTIVYNVPVGVQEASSNLRCTIYPNPSSGKIQLTLHNVAHPEIKIYNGTGQTVYTATNMEVEHLIDIHQEPAGIYFYELLSNGSLVETGKIIIRK